MRLPKGMYVIDATYAGRKVRLEACDGMRTRYVLRPANPRTDFPGSKNSERER